jgi:peptidoglycan/xylan/chitin deacetylase (PgdA/CDA1 family)
MDTSLLITPSPPGIPLRLISGAALAAVVAPVAGWGTDGTASALITSVAAISIGVTLAIVVARLVPRPRLAWLGVLLVAAAALLIAVTPRGVITVSIAALAGFGAGLVTPRAAPLRDRWGIAGLIGAVGIGAILLAAAHATAALWWVVVLAVVAAVVNMFAVREERRQAATSRFTLGLGVVSTAWAILLMSWVAANTPTVNWFGGTVSHGPRHGNEVAITFDDGPDDPFTLEIRDILDAHGVKATFFTVGKALDARPDITRALYDDGQLLGNHSYHHDYWRWLDPRYLELGRTQDAFQRALGVCPGFFRPPHGQRTPFMSWLVHRSDMAMVTWDVSAADWVSHDGAEVAAKVLARTKPGSIILLHDGIDGTVHADRSVILTALPLILDGLKARGLQPVRLDQLLGKPGYVDC